MKCLIVDDDVELLALTRHYLCKHLPPYWTIYTAHNGFQARKWLHQLHGVYMLVTDRHMPGENGISLLHFTAENWPATHFILMSSDTQGIYRAPLSHHFKMQGIQGKFLSKPFSLNTLLHCIQESYHPAHCELSS